MKTRLVIILASGLTLCGCSSYYAENTAQTLDKSRPFDSDSSALDALTSAQNAQDDYDLAYKVYKKDGYSDKTASANALDDTYFQDGDLPASIPKH